MEEEAMKSSFPSWMMSLGKAYKQQGDALFTEAPLSRFEHVMESLRHHGIRVCNAITGYDSGKDYEVLYHFVHAGLVLTVKFRISRDAPKIPSLAKVFPSAHLFELETREMLGVEFVGNHDMRSVMLSDEAPRTPLRKPDPPQPQGTAPPAHKPVSPKPSPARPTAKRKGGKQ
jgi:NADH:ubiquinone oxidoreductase subunit C